MDSVEDLKKNIDSIYETDMGDFKRRSVTYLNRYLETLNSDTEKMKIKQIKKFVVCYITPEQDIIKEIDELRHVILQKL